MPIIITLMAILIVPLILSGILFVSIVWTHRPALSVADILRECAKEIISSMCR